MKKTIEELRSAVNDLSGGLKIGDDVGAAWARTFLRDALTELGELRDQEAELAAVREVVEAIGGLYIYHKKHYKNCKCEICQVLTAYYAKVVTKK